MQVVRKGYFPCYIRARDHSPGPRSLDVKIPNKKWVKTSTARATLCQNLFELLPPTNVICIIILEQGGLSTTQATRHE
jgi:hypothetical protein